MRRRDQPPCRHPSLALVLARGDCSTTPDPSPFRHQPKMAPPGKWDRSSNGPRAGADLAAYNPGAVRDQYQREGMLMEAGDGGDRLQPVPVALPGSGSAQVRRLPTRAMPGGPNHGGPNHGQSPPGLPPVPAEPSMAQQPGGQPSTGQPTGARLVVPGCPGGTHGLQWDAVSGCSRCLPRWAAPCDPGSGRRQAGLSAWQGQQGQAAPVETRPRVPIRSSARSVRDRRCLPHPSSPRRLHRSRRLRGDRRGATRAARPASRSGTRCNRRMRRGRRSASRWRVTPRHCGLRPSWRGNPGCPRTSRRASCRDRRCRSTSC